MIDWHWIPKRRWQTAAAIIDWHWLLNGKMLPYKPLKQEIVDRLRHAETIHGVQVFVSPDVPLGDIELHDRDGLIAIVKNIGK